MFNSTALADILALGAFYVVVGVEHTFAQSTTLTKHNVLAYTSVGV